MIVDLWPEYAVTYTLQRATYATLADGRQEAHWATVSTGSAVFAPASHSLVAMEAGAGVQVDHVLYADTGAFENGERVLIAAQPYEVTKVTNYGDHVEVQCHAVL